MAGGLLAAQTVAAAVGRYAGQLRSRAARFWHRWLLVPICSLAAAIAFFFAIAAPHADPHTDIATLLAQGGAYNLSLGHIFDLTHGALYAGLFRGPLTLVGFGMITIGPLTYVLRRSRHTYSANLSLAAAAAVPVALYARGSRSLLPHTRFASTRQRNSRRPTAAAGRRPHPHRRRTDRRLQLCSSTLASRCTSSTAA